MTRGLCVVALCGAALAFAARAEAQVCGVEPAPEDCVTPAPAPPPPPAPPPSSNTLFAAAILAVAAAGGLWIGRGRLAGALRRSWSPYVAGAGLGLVATVSLAVFGHRLSGSGAYHQLAGHVGRWLWPDQAYFRSLPAGMTWEMWVLVGTLLGAFASALAGRQVRLRTMPDSQWSDVFGTSVARRWLLVFAGTAVIQIASGIAGGCTAGLAVSGGAALAPGAFVFMAGMFAGGIPVARFLYRRRRQP
jgi:uncharacterized protein